MKTIKIKDSTHMMLLVLKLQNKFKTIDQVIDNLIDRSLELDQKNCYTMQEYREAMKTGILKKQYNINDGEHK